MKKIQLLLIGLLLIPTLFLTSCDKGDENAIVETPRFNILKDYVISNDLDIMKINTDKVATAPDLAGLNTFLDTYYIIDIRTLDAFNVSHIEGAKNVAFTDILKEGENAKNVGKPALVVCYTGQTATYATALMKLYGYSNTKALKWGMSSWSPETATSWNNQFGSNPAQGHANWSTDVAPINDVFIETPFINSLSTDGNSILKERVKQVVSEGFKTVANVDVLENPDGYFINNFFSEAHYLGFGHISGAYRISPITFNDNFQNLDPNAKIVTYCYTGQTSALITACLRVLGYDAYTLTFGMNGLYNNNPYWNTPISNYWGVDGKPKNLPLITN